MKLRKRAGLLEARITQMEEQGAKQAGRLRCLEVGHEWEHALVWNNVWKWESTAPWGLGRCEVGQMPKGKLKARHECARCHDREEQEFDLNTAVGRKAFEAFLRGE